MIQKKKPGVDVIMDILLAAGEAYPNTVFVQSLLYQYQERGGLSRKQLEGLYGKAQKINGLAPAKLATLQAIILKKPVKQRSDKPAATAAPVQQDNSTAETISQILAVYPQHKRLLFYKARLDNKEIFSAAEKAEIEKFKKILLK
jgi:hypothetical protein